MADTVIFTPASTSWSDLGAMPLMVENDGTVPVRLQVSTASPGADTHGHFSSPRHLYPELVTHTFNLSAGDTRHVWARAASESGESGRLIVSSGP